MQVFAVFSARAKEEKASAISNRLDKETLSKDNKDMAKEKDTATTEKAKGTTTTNKGSKRKACNKRSLQMWTARTHG